MSPAKDANLELLQEHPSHSLKYARIDGRMKGRIIVRIYSLVGIKMSTETTQMRVTLEGGPLMGINYVSEKAIAQVLDVSDMKCLPAWREIPADFLRSTLTNRRPL